MKAPFFLNGEECRFKSVRDSEAAQIAIIHQQLALIPGLSIAENIFAGNEREKHGVINWNETRARAKELMARVGLTEDPDTPVQDIGTGKQQLVEICKAISKDVQLLILDEPTASLNDEESEKLLNLVLEFKKQGITSILISHKLRELTMVGDAITVLRDGETIETLYKEKEPFSEDQIIHAMVGRELVNRFPHRTAEIGAVSLEIRDWNVFSPLNERRQILKNINMVAHRARFSALPD
ncbi:MAG: ATP-binding cassette domain-containing protein [Oscillospiraceae bacterium]